MTICFHVLFNTRTKKTKLFQSDKEAVMLKGGNARQIYLYVKLKSGTFALRNRKECGILNREKS
jgi:hypothetical protein